MKLIFKSCRPAIALSLLAGVVLAHAGAPSEENPGPRSLTDLAVELRLADGSVVRVSSEEGDRRSINLFESTLDDASLTAGPRRAPLRRRSQVFDPQTPGVVASVRG